MPILRDLDAQFIRYETRIETWDVIDGDAGTWRERGCPTKKFTGPKVYQVHVPSIAEAQGILLQCPKCHTGSGHYLAVTFSGRGVQDTEGSHNSDGHPTRWSASGSGLDDLTTQPSIHLEDGCNWHGYITNGSAD